jgi:hypothetical protein
MLKRLVSALVFNHLKGTGNHIGLSETAAETIDFRSSLLLPRMNKLPEIIVFSPPETHRPGPARSVLRKIVSGTPEIVAYTIFPDPINCS